MKPHAPATLVATCLLLAAVPACTTRTDTPLAALAAKEAPALSIGARTYANTLASRLESDFVYPEQGRRYAAMLTANTQSGAYDPLSGAELAERLTADLQAVAPDGHLRVMYQGQGGGGPRIVIAGPPGADDGAPVPGGPPRMVRLAPPPAIEAPQWLAPGVAFVRFNLFPGDPQTNQAAADFMAAHADAKVIIFDIRTHMGGGLGEMDEIFPWLFAEPTRLVSMATRKSVDEAGGSPIADVASLRVVEGDPDVIVREHWVTPREDSPLTDAKVYVLTSSMTGSAAEHFALALKRTARATLIGSATYGANHFGGDQDIGGDFTAFIPVGRTYNPETGEDWEGKGVAPDIDVPPGEALIEALKLAGVPAEEAARLSASVAPMVPMRAPGASAG